MKKTILLSALIAQSAFSAAGPSKVTLYAYRSPYGVDWSTPSTLTMSSIKNTAAYVLGITDNKRRIGHVTVKMDCAQQDGKREIVHTGMGAVDSRGETLKLLLKRNSALGVLFHRFKGRLDDPKELEAEIKKGQKSGEINSLTYLIDDQKCQELLEHNKKWRESKAYLNYGLIESPNEYTGAGCSAYVMSYLGRDIAPKVHKSNWKGHVMIDNKLIGAHNRKRYTKDDQGFFFPEKDDGGMSVFSLLLNADTWHKEGEEATRLDYWSPDMMFDWIEDSAKLGNSQSPAPLKIEKTDKTHHIVFDLRSSK